MDTLFRRMTELGIDTDRSREVLQRYNDGDYDDVRPVVPRRFPRLDGQCVIDRTSPAELILRDDAYRERLASLAPEIPAEIFGTVRESTDGRERVLPAEALRRVGILLYPYLSYGVLNGGSASSYADRTKNTAFDPKLMHLYQREFDRLAPIISDRPKGITPAWVNPDGTPGASFLELKMRMLLRAGMQYDGLARELSLSPPENLLPTRPMLEMTSFATEKPLRRAYEDYRGSPLLAGLPGAGEIGDTLHAVQPLLAAMTHSDQGRPKRFFTSAYGQEGEPLGLPGGHGQNFQVLAGIYRELYRRGKRFVYLGNVDNVGFTVDPVSLALVALQKSPAGFDFAFRTPVDVKGGILVYDQNDNLNCADIGPAISRDSVLAAEAEGEHILFNCATGLFDLEYLCENLDRIVNDLPMRISDQEKDAGRYSQAEQVTWEVIAMLDRPLVFGIDKYRRFLAAKMFVETLLTSGLHREDAARTQPTVNDLSSGLTRVLTEEYALKLRDGRWVPREEVDGAGG
jgi:UTP--glucose-1-phosphate uridylyltransferase